MKILGSDSEFYKKDRVGGSEKSGKAVKSDSTSSSLSSSAEPQSGAEKVAVSDFAKEVVKIHAQVKSAPEARVEKVVELKGKIDSGNYHIPAEKIAGKIVDDIIKQGQ